MFSFWNGTGGVSGDFSFGTVHLLSVLFVIICSVGLTLWGMKSSDKARRNILITIASLAISFEVFWRIVYAFKGVGFSGLYPFYPCNVAGVIVPLIAFSKNDKLKRLFYVFAFIGGILTFAIPDGIFNNKYLTFGILKSILQHWAIIVIPVYEYFTKTFKPKFIHFHYTLIGMTIHLLNSEFLPKLINGQEGTDYMFLRSGLPFVLPGVPGWLTMSIFGVIVVTLVNAALDYKGFLSLIRRKNKKKLKTN